MMHVLGAGHISPSQVGYPDQGSNSGKLSTIMAQKICDGGSTGYRGATRGASTAEHPVVTGTGHLFIPQAELSFLAQHHAWFTADPTMRKRVISWYPKYDADSDCVQYLALKDVGDIGVLKPYIAGQALPGPEPVLFGCEHTDIADATPNASLLGWHLPVVDINQPESTNPTTTLNLYTADGTHFLGGINFVPSTGPTNSKQLIFSDLVGTKHVPSGLGLLPACMDAFCPREESWERLYVESGTGDLVPTTAFWDLPRACPNAGGVLGWPSYPCCPGVE